MVGPMAWEHTLVNEDFPFEGGSFLVSDRPGLGYTLNHEAVRKYLVQERIFGVAATGHCPHTAEDGTRSRAAVAGRPRRDPAVGRGLRAVSVSAPAQGLLRAHIRKIEGSIHYIH